MTDCLIVDDSKIVRTVAKRIVEPLGFATREAEDGQQAVDRCGEKMPDVILLDWHMPVMNGLEFIQALRKMPGGDKPKVIFCTTETELKNIQEALKFGADEYVMKPYDDAILKDKLQQVNAL